MAKKEKVRDLGIPGIEAPSERCNNDVSCPFHGRVGIRGRIFTAKVASVKATKLAVVSWERRKFVPKYERFEKRKSKAHAHAPSCLRIHKDDTVLIGECRPLSKTKKFVVIQKIGE